MFEVARILFALAVIIAAMMIGPGIKEMREGWALQRGDTTEIQKADFKWKDKFEEADSVWSASPFAIEVIPHSANDPDLIER